MICWGLVFRGYTSENRDGSKPWTLQAVRFISASAVAYCLLHDAIQALSTWKRCQPQGLKTILSDPFGFDAYSMLNPIVAISAYAWLGITVERELRGQPPGHRELSLVQTGAASMAVWAAAIGTRILLSKVRMQRK